MLLSTESFHVVRFIMLYKVLFCLWAKPYCATIQMKAIEDSLKSNFTR